VALHIENNERLGFNTDQGLYQFTLTLFILCNSLETLNWLMKPDVWGIIYKACLVYLDDIIVNQMFQEQTKNLFRMFQEA
jgi:hypothetical protein